MSTIRRVAHIGASGFIGSAVLEALIARDLELSVLVRKEGEASFSGHVKVVRVDLRDRRLIVEALQGQDAVVSTVGVKEINSQYEMIDAAIEAGVKRFIPVSENPGSTFSYTTISTSVLIEAVLRGPLPDIRPKARRAMIFDGGDVPVSMTPAYLVGESAVAVLKKPEDTRNRSLLIHGGFFKQNQFLSLAQKQVGTNDWEIEQEKTSDMEQRSWKAFESDTGNILGWLPGFVRLGLFGEGYGGDFAGRTANVELGLNGFTVRDLDALIKNLVQ